MGNPVFNEETSEEDKLICVIRKYREIVGNLPSEGSTADNRFKIREIERSLSYIEHEMLEFINANANRIYHFTEDEREFYTRRIIAIVNMLNINY